MSPCARCLPPLWWSPPSRSSSAVISTWSRCCTICPNGKLRQQFHQTVVRREIFELLEEMQNVPSVKQLDARLRQLRPDVLLVDLTEEHDPEATP